MTQRKYKLYNKRSGLIVSLSKSKHPDGRENTLTSLNPLRRNNYWKGFELRPVCTVGTSVFTYLPVYYK